MMFLSKSMLIVASLVTCSLIAVIDTDAVMNGMRATRNNTDVENSVEVIVLSLKGCGPCGRMHEEAEKLNAHGLRTRQVYGQEADELAKKYNVTIRGYPTTIIIINGQRQGDSLVGFRSAAQIEAEVNRLKKRAGVR